MSSEFLGLKLIEEKEIKCSKCNKSLVSVILTETNDDRKKRGLNPLFSKFKVNKCYSCGGQSFWTKVFEGSTSLGTFLDDISIDEEDTEIADGIVSTIISTKRCKND